MKLIVYDRKTVANLNPPTVDWGLISISHTSDWPDVYESESLLGRLNQLYHDVDVSVDTVVDKKGRILFSMEQANSVLDFYEEMVAKKCSVIIVHCLMGMCRSPATAAALQKIHTGNDDIWFQTKRPNMRVYRSILNAAADRGLIG